ncbi:MAG TPA: hypothetical protein VG759_11970 [Candidatus Angelobacter sp.]|jgi:hypothetical protein|nr:hypothetical protein [Candidatus Angelobacter sp.]
MKLMVVVVTILISTSVTADVLRLKDTGAIQDKGHGRTVPAPEKDGKKPAHKADIEWTDCAGKAKIYEDADKYEIDLGDNCIEHSAPGSPPKQPPRAD